MAECKVPMTTVIKIMETHAGGYPLRIVESGIPEPEGKTFAEKSTWMQTHADHYRKLLTHLPRDHRDMAAMMNVTPDLPEADLGLIVMHNGGYSPVCGGGVMSIGRYAVDKGLVTAVSPETRLVLQCPCGPITAYVTYDGKAASDVRFLLQPCYVFDLDVQVSIPTREDPVTVDMVWSGAFYAFLPAAHLGLDLGTATSSELIEFFQLIKKAVDAEVALHQPDYPYLAFLYGVIFTDGQGRDAQLRSSDVHQQVCVFGQQQLDYSPCGSGSAARAALEYHRGLLPLGQKRGYRSAVSGATYKASVVREMKVMEGAGRAQTNATGVVVEVSGRAFYTGSSVIRVEEEDPLAGGYTNQ